MGRLLRAEAAVVVAGPPERAFEIVTDIERSHQWAPPVRAVRRTSGGEFGLGATFDEETTVMGRTVTTGKRVVAYEPPTRYGERADKGLFPHEVDYRFEAVEGPGGGEATRVTLTVEGTPSRLLGLAGPLLRRQLEGELEASLEGLKRHLA